VLEGLTKITDRVHALLDSLTAKHVGSQLEPALIELARIHWQPPESRQ
jgi:hypothetical protein